MTTRSGWIAAAAMAAVLASAGSVRAQANPAQQEQPAPDAEGRGRGNRPMSTLPTGDLVNMLDTYAIVQAQEALALNDAQYGQFVTRLKRLQETRRRSQRERNQILQDLRKLTGPQAQASVDEAAVRERLKALRDQDDRASVELRKAYDALDEVPDVRQQARFRIFEETMERRKLDLLVRARERAAQQRQGSR